MVVTGLSGMVTARSGASRRDRAGARQPGEGPGRGATGEADRVRFSSSILPKWARRTRSLDALLPVLYLRGVSTGIFRTLWRPLLGKEAPNPSTSVITRLTAQWNAEYDRWQKRDLSARHYVYV